MSIIRRNTDPSRDELMARANMIGYLLNLRPDATVQELDAYDNVTLSDCVNREYPGGIDAFRSESNERLS